MQDNGGARTTPTSALSTAALAFARRGLAVFPCWPCTKKPVTTHGFKDATTDPSVIERWWLTNPDYNIAIATGAVSGVLIVDVDGIDAEAELRKLEGQHGALPATVEAITAHCRHLYFQMPDGVDARNSAGKIAPGIDVRSNGGYVMAPPSVHPSGRRYAWSVDSARAFAATPYWLLGKIVAGTGGGNGTVPVAEWRELVQGVAEGARDCSVARLAGHLLRRDVDPFVTLALLQCWNAASCTPPLPAADITRIVNSIAGKELRRRIAGG
jgi:hypothetical protein